MSVADELKKYKALLDDGVLTQEEFDAKKKELLGLGEQELQSAEQREKKEEPRKKEKSKKSKKGLKILLIILLVLIVLAGAAFGIMKGIETSQDKQRFAAVEEAIRPVMEEYGLTEYEVKYCGVINEIYCPAIEELSYQSMMEMIRQLNEMDPITDPVEGDNLEMDSNKFYVDDSPAHYYYISQGVYSTRKTMRDVLGFEDVNVETPGLYFAGEKILSDD